MNSNEFEFLNNTTRWNSVKRHNDESVAHHSYIVTIFAYAIAVDLINGELKDYKRVHFLNTVMMQSLFHDFDEMYTGDLLHVLKHNNVSGAKIREGLNEYIAERLNQISSTEGSVSVLKDVMLTNLSETKSSYQKFVNSIVKLSDWLSALRFVNNEKSLGNSNLNEEFLRCIEKTIAACDKCFELTLMQNEKITQSSTPEAQKRFYNTQILSDIKTEIEMLTHNQNQ